MTGFNPQSVKEVKPSKTVVEKLNSSKVKATYRQKRLVQQLVEHPSSLKKAMVAVGYSESTAVAPSKVTESKGFLALADAVGLTDDFLLRALQDDIVAKPANRTPELSLAFKVRGRLKDDAQTSNFTPATINITLIKDVPNDTLPLQGQVTTGYTVGEGTTPPPSA